MTLIITDAQGNRVPTKIIVQTRAGNNLDNQQSWHLLPNHLHEDAGYRSAYQAPNAYFRCAPCPVYNCHGLTFASRRTWLFQPSDLSRIIEEDGYGSVTKESVLPGDVVLYFEEGDVSHSGIVVGLERSGGLLDFLVWSKWGCGSEVVHRLYACPYKVDRVEFYRITR